MSEWLPPGEQHTLVTVSLESVGEDETRLLLVHEELPDGDAYQGHESGWQNIVTGLGARLEWKEDP